MRRPESYAAKDGQNRNYGVTGRKSYRPGAEPDARTERHFSKHAKTRDVRPQGIGWLGDWGNQIAQYGGCDRQTRGSDGENGQLLNNLSSMAEMKPVMMPALPSGIADE